MEAPCYEGRVSRALPALLLLSLACGGAPTPDAGPDAGVEEGDAGRPLRRVRVATFNTRLFFDTVCQSGACASTDFEQQSTQAAFDARATQLADAIAALDADLVALQELETQACLDALLARLTAKYPHGVLGEIGGAGSVDVALLSKTPLEGVKGYRASVALHRPDGSRTSFSRELLEGHARVEGREVVLFAAHFRSKSNDDPGRRLAEAQAARTIVAGVAAARPDALVLLAGDLNDTPGSPPLEALTADGGLLRAAADLPEAEQGTYVWSGRAEAIDHVLQAVTPGGALVPRSARVWKDGRGYGGSDHAALSAEFELR